jgi:hypothetical protein
MGRARRRQEWFDVLHDHSCCWGPVVGAALQNSDSCRRTEWTVHCAVAYCRCHSHCYPTMLMLQHADAPRKTKIVCTLGPSCWSDQGLAALIDAGMNVARFNFSHGDHAGHGEVLDRLRKVSGVGLHLLRQPDMVWHMTPARCCAGTNCTDGDSSPRCSLLYDDVDVGTVRLHVQGG